MTEKKLVNRWPHVRLDQMPDIDRMHPDTLDLLNTMCEWASKMHGWQSYINSSYRGGDSGQHGLGRAVDLVFFKRDRGDVPVMEQFLFALRFGWTGVGFYPHWHYPGIHVDTRELEEPYRALWWRDGDGTYYAGDTLRGNLRWT